ncbi:MAG: MerR family transcriptional regulator [Planctomycetota bacterium]|nr:MerR family transcriptional regulator [Planctomycetota bacterium]
MCPSTTTPVGPTACRTSRRRSRATKYINGTQLAKQLGIGASTLCRWVKAGKLPKPERSISGMLLFDRAAIDRLGR